MHIKRVSTALIASFVSVGALAGFEQFSEPRGGVWAIPQNGDPAFGIFPFGVAALQSTTTDDREFELLPNVNLYNDNPGDAVWRNNGGAGPDGNSILQATTSFEIDDLTSDITTIVFEFTVDDYDLDARYGVEGFVKVLDKLSGSFAILDSDIQPINRFGLFQLQVDVSGGAFTGQLVQAGWTMTGLNANPADDWGSVKVTATELSAVSADNTAPQPDPMGFLEKPLGATSTSISMTASNAVDDVYGVEYLFTNTVNNTSSGWQSSPSWLDAGPDGGVVNTNMALENGDFELGGAGWDFSNGGGSATLVTTTNISGNTSAYSVVDGTSGGGGWAVVVDVVAPLSGTPYSGGDTITFGADIRALSAGLNGGGALLKIEAYEGGVEIANTGDQVQTVTDSWAFYSFDYTIPSGADELRFVLGTSTGWGGANAEPSEYLFDNVSITGEVAVAGGLTPGGVYSYMVKARDTGPNLNETAWSVSCSATSEVSDVTAPTPDPMGFAVAPFALGEEAISMTASTATDDLFDVEYLFTNTVNGTSSGWQSSPTWVDTGILDLVNPDFEAGAIGWTFENNVGWGDPSGATTTNISGNESAYAYVDGSQDNGNGGYAVIYQEISLTNSSFKAGDDITVSADVRALAGLNGGGTAFKIEAYNGASKIDDTGDLAISVTESWVTYSVPYTIIANTDALKIVLVVSTGWGGPNAFDSHYLFDNVSVSKPGGLNPGTEYTYMVKARDTSPSQNETAWSAPFSATTTGMGPVIPFSIDSAEFVDGVGFAFGWQGTSGYTYDLEYTTNLVTGPWMVDPSPGASGILSAGGTESATSTVNGASIFYRVTTQ